MQDLGNINITIRGGAQGGATGSGQPGGGPGFLPSSPTAPGRNLPTPAVSPAAVPSAPGADPGEALGGAATPSVSSFQMLMQRLQSGSAIKSEIGGFLRSPSLGGLAQLGEASSATGGALAELSGVLSAAGPIAIGVLAAVGSVIVTLKMLSAAAEMTARRIEETMRFSGVLQFQAGVEKFRQFERTLADLNRNGKLYAESQRLATMVNDAQAAATLQLNGIIAEAGMTWQKLELGFWTMLELFGKAVNMFKSVMDMIGVTIEDMLLFAVSPITGPMLSWLKEPLMQILQYLGLINANTKPKPGAVGINDWFMGDLAAMTRRKDAYNPPYRRGSR